MYKRQGVGSVAEGFRAGAGFDIAYPNDVDPAARDTYQQNYGTDVPYDLIDVKDVTADDIRARSGGRPIAGLLGLRQEWKPSAGRRGLAQAQSARPTFSRSDRRSDFNLVSCVHGKSVRLARQLQ